MGVKQNEVPMMIVESKPDDQRFRKAWEVTLSTVDIKPKFVSEGKLQLDLSGVYRENGYAIPLVLATNQKTPESLMVVFNQPETAQRFDRELTKNLAETGCPPVNKTLFLPQSDGGVRVIGYQPWN